MKIRYTTYIFLLLFLGVIQQSCVNDYDDSCNGVPEDKVTFRFNLNLGDLGRDSRADGVWNPSGPSEEGSLFDNFIYKKIKDESAVWFHVMIIDNSGRLLHLDLNEGYQYNPVEGGYDMTGSLSLDDLDGWSSGEYRVMLLVNIPDRLDNGLNIKGAETLTQLASVIGNLSLDWYTGDGKRNKSEIPYIPMWGMTTAQFSFDGKTAQYFSIEMLRALAKVKIVLDDDLMTAGYRIESCIIDNLNRSFNPIPSGWNQCKVTADLTQPFYDAAFNVNSTNPLQNFSLDFSGLHLESDSDGSVAFYLPEWQSNDNSKVGLTLGVRNDINEIETCQMIIDNAPEGSGKIGYYANRYNVNRNHLYQFSIDKAEGELFYQLDCWNLVESAIGWNPPSWTFDSNDTEAVYGYVSFPTYPSSKGKYLILNETSFADYTFTLTGPEGAVWKAFLIEDGIEYSAETTFKNDWHSNNANTPNGFFFGDGNEDKNNYKAVSTGIARETPYNIKIGTRLRTTNFTDTVPEMLYSDINEPDVTPESPFYKEIIALNGAGNYWKNKGKVPTCYLVIKIALDGKNFSETLAINPAKNSGDYVPYKFAGDDTHIEIRQLFPFYRHKSVIVTETNDAGETKNVYEDIFNNNDFVIGINSNKSDYKTYTWWSYPMGHKDNH